MEADSKTTNEAAVLHDELENRYREFVRGPYRNLLGENEWCGGDRHLRALQKNLETRFASVIRPDTEACLSLLEQLGADIKGARR